jgi:ADP-dependent NAD(P)H-hydrate dehydratase / NAD(P)H-hydrate epimerase
MSFLPSHPILDCIAAGAFEAELLKSDDEREWKAMQRAGAAIAAGLQRDLTIAGAHLRGGRLLVVAGKGHNGGDAMLAAARLAAQYTDLQVDLVLVFGERSLRPLAARAFRELARHAPDRVTRRRPDGLASRYTIVIDGVFGFQFRPPLKEPARSWLVRVNAVNAVLRAAVDLPSGNDDVDAFHADMTYATGIVKSPLLELPNAGRVRYLDLGFFRGDEPGEDRALTSATLDSLRRLRPARSDKRSYGHLLVLGGSRSYPGAIMMAVQAALRSGVGLLTAFVPESLAPAYAAAWPEAMWTGCPETAEGGLGLDSGALVRARLERASALLIGPGLGRDPETLALVKDLMRQTNLPVVIDADALQPDIVWSGSGPRVLTPHAGEYERISNGVPLREFRPTRGCVTVLKGPITRVSDGTGAVYHDFGGGPVLARGGSGDLLAGMIGSLVAQGAAALHRSEGGGAMDALDEAVTAAAVRGVVWHSRAADLLAETRGEVAVRTTDLLEFLGPALRQP